MPASTRPRRLQFNVAEWERIAERRKLHTLAAQAEFLGVDYTVLGRIIRGECLPGQSFIAQTMTALEGVRGATFKRMFPIVDVQPDRAEAA